MWMHLILCFFCLYSWELCIYWKEISTNVIFLLISPLWKQGEVRCSRTLREKFSNIFIWPTMHLSNPFFNESWADGFLSYIAQTFHLRIRLDISVEQAFSFFFFPFFSPVRIPVHPASSWIGNTKGTVLLGVFWYICFLFCLKQSRTVNTKTRKWKQRALNKIFFSSILRHLNLILWGILACIVLCYSEFMGIIDYISGRYCFHNMQMQHK